ncbi:RHS repeat-associated core domain-containing protein [Streptomonospora nanhaiensis]|uniref:RHS repeat-associated core domain-containing protein n=1 Tax=Streptomonospora nanhaiensis TaxID=1323731 RepID=A0ABY6YW13_9ACTN|nr:RHS repeat-associated core domain-containing protein [Streptomonospora nanhaiensis]WAE76587.1 RHS repeat-associated core domain-containing protein [Streptomonospora nanhaiensis]
MVWECEFESPNGNGAGGAFGCLDGNANGAWPNSRGFVGGIVDDQAGLTRLGARSYDSGLGSFISPDPVVDTADSQQMHGYSYSNNNPVSFTDPDGLFLRKSFAQARQWAAQRARQAAIRAYQVRMAAIRAYRIRQAAIRAAQIRAAKATAAARKAAAMRAAAARKAAAARAAREAAKRRAAAKKASYDRRQDPKPLGLGKPQNPRPIPLWDSPFVGSGFPDKKLGESGEKIFRRGGCPNG